LKPDAPEATVKITSPGRATSTCDIQIEESDKLRISARLRLGAA
jgi:hypothetical protein